MKDAATERGSPTIAVALRATAVAVLVSVPTILYVALPVDLRLRVEDATGRPLEAVVVRVVHSRDPRDFVEVFTDVDGRARASVSGFEKHIDVTVNPGAGPYQPGAHRCRGATAEEGPTYATHHTCGIGATAYDDEALTIELPGRLPTRQICRLTGRGARNGPYQYAGHDSAITVPWVRARGGVEREDVLWWFGDTTDVPGGEIFVPNKMAVSDGAADAANCLDLQYLGPRDHGPLPVDATITTEATVWLDVPLVSSSVPDPREHGGYAFRPQLGDRLHVGYLSVESTPPLFKITHLGLATLAACAGDCSETARADGFRLVREPDAIWHAPTEYARAPEGSAFRFGDVYTILKVAERRTYCALPPHEPDCSADRPCANGDECIEPGKFCDAPPHVSCRRDAECGAGRCVAGGVIAMQVDRARVTEKSAYRYWNAETRTFEPYVAREPDAILVDSHVGNSVSVMWSEQLDRWLMISNEEAPHFVGQSVVNLRTAPELLGPWGATTRIMENLGGQRSYNPRFVPRYTRPSAPHFVYWTATYDAYDVSQPMHGKDFDYNVFLYETDLREIDQIARR